MTEKDNYLAKILERKQPSDDGGFSEEGLERAKALISLYPKKRSALIPLCHLAQGEHGWLTERSMEEIAELLEISVAEVSGTASFYDMLHLEPVGNYVISVCTNIACMLGGAYELLESIEERLGISVGQTTLDMQFTLEEAECLGACDTAPCLQVNSRFFGNLDAVAFDKLVTDLASGALAGVVPPHGVLSRVQRVFSLMSGEQGEAAASNTDETLGQK
ncbi:MAG: NAD(P)H-dependent oxidoreductase subunit E [Firmicutes bacterium]|nr:NAD(P)H-dependent oxidoreductase subunit E [Bacillota bacterium]